MCDDNFTYVSESHGATSWLDHCICTLSAREYVANFKIRHDLVCSAHIPVYFTIDKNVTRRQIPCPSALSNGYMVVTVVVVVVVVVHPMRSL